MSGGPEDPTEVATWIVIAFVQGRPELEARLRRRLSNPWAAPEELAIRARETLHRAWEKVTVAERAKLEPTSNWNIHWKEVWRQVADHFSRPDIARKP